MPAPTAAAVPVAGVASAPVRTVPSPTIGRGATDSSRPVPCARRHRRRRGVVGGRRPLRGRREAVAPVVPSRPACGRTPPPSRVFDRVATSAIRFASRLRDLPDPTEAARVVAVWQGIRWLHGAPPEQAAPLMPPELFAVLDACPEVRHWKTRGRALEPDLAGLRDRVLLLVGFVGALRRSELVGLDVDHVAEHPNGLVITLSRSKTNQTGEEAELVVLPRGGDPRRCAVTAIRNWTEVTGIEDGPLLRPVSKGNRAVATAESGLGQHARADLRPSIGTMSSTWSTMTGPGGSISTISVSGR